MSAESHHKIDTYIYRESLDWLNEMGMEQKRHVQSRKRAESQRRQICREGVGLFWDNGEKQ